MLVEMCNNSVEPGSESGDGARIQTTSRDKKEGRIARKKTKKREREKTEKCLNLPSQDWTLNAMT